jgi:hypothetical protein
MRRTCLPVPLAGFVTPLSADFLSKLGKEPMRTQTLTTDSLNTKLLLKTLVAFRKSDFSLRLLERPDCQREFHGQLPHRPGAAHRRRFILGAIRLLSVHCFLGAPMLSAGVCGGLTPHEST